MALEAAAAEEEKKKKKKAAASTTTSRKKATAKVVGRTKVVWEVCNAASKTVATFPYPQEQEARTEADRLQEKSGSTHYVARKQVPFE